MTASSSSFSLSLLLDFDYPGLPFSFLLLRHTQSRLGRLGGNSIHCIWHKFRACGLTGRRRNNRERMQQWMNDATFATTTTTTTTTCIRGRQCPRRWALVNIKALSLHASFAQVITQQRRTTTTTTTIKKKKKKKRTQDSHRTVRKNGCLSIRRSNKQLQPFTTQFTTLTMF